MTTMRGDDMADRQTSSTNQTRVAATTVTPSDADKPTRRNTAASRSQAPQVTTEIDEGGVAHLGPSTTDPGAWRAAFLAVFGTDDASVAEHLYQQLLALLRPDPNEPLCARTANLALSLLQGLAPQNEVEALLSIQLLGCHLGAVATMQRALRADQPMHAQQTYCALAGKLMRTFTQQLDALTRMRGKATVQRVVVERVTVETGAQAVVGAVTRGSKE
jgi:hypothetical protein